MVACRVGSMLGVQQTAVGSSIGCSTGTEATGTKVPAGPCLKPSVPNALPTLWVSPVVDFGVWEKTISTGTSIPVSG